MTDYTYNGWGEILKTDNKIGDFGNLNPIRYRGYYYDSELNMYYLQSRYYDPVMKRMLCADDENITEDSTMSNHNLFTYCDNNSVNRADDEGDFWNIVSGAVIGAALSGASTVFTNVVCEKKKWNDGLTSSVISGAASGALASTGAGVLAQGIGNGVISAVTSAATQCYESKSIKKINKGAVVKSFAAGFVSGISGGSGMRSKKSSYQVTRKNAKEVWSKVVKKQYRTPSSMLKRVTRADKKLRAAAKKCTIQTSIKFLIGTRISYRINKVKWKKVYRFLFRK